MNWTPKSEAEWLAIAKDVMAGKYRSADKSTIESILIGLRSHPHITAAQAVMKLQERK